MIKYQKNNEVSYGFNSITKESDYSENMLMDFDVFKGKEGETLKLHDEVKETAIILFDGKIEFVWEGKKVVAERHSVFDEGPYTIHVAKDKKVEINFLTEGEIGIQKATNEREFESKLYTPDDCVDQFFGAKGMQGTARRLVRDIFKYDNAPYSNLVIGEVITYPGKWSSYPSHSHDQPEVYYYKFTKPQGFGAGFVGEDVFKIKDNSALLIRGGVSHPQTSAPGYGMYYCWMIRNLPNNPWTKRVNEKAHEWLLDENAKIWEPSK